MKEALEEHRQLVEAISSRDGETARRLAQEHIENAENCLMNVIHKDAKIGGA
jgi:DNA-binding FadR family transcriptional regulator